MVCVAHYRPLCWQRGPKNSSNKHRQVHTSQMVQPLVHQAMMVPCLPQAMLIICGMQQHVLVWTAMTPPTKTINSNAVTNNSTQMQRRLDMKMLHTRQRGIMKRTCKTLKRTHSTMKRTGKMMKRTGKMMKRKRRKRQ